MPKAMGCPTETVLGLIAGRWKVLVIWWLLQETRRFNQLQRDLRGITHRTLARTLPQSPRMDARCFGVRASGKPA